MVRIYYSIALDHTADQVWAVVRRFNRIQWTGASVDTGAENGMPDDLVGAVRHARVDGEQICQRLIDHSDLDRTYSYENCETASKPSCSYRATIRVCSIVETDKAFVEWWASFDDAADDRSLTDNLSTNGFAKSLIALRSFMASRNAERLLSSSAGITSRPRSTHAQRPGRAILRLV
jgi:hypothetical protein